MFQQVFYNEWNFEWTRGVPQTFGLLAHTFCLSTTNDKQIPALSYNFPLTAAKNVKLHMLVWRIACKWGCVRAEEQVCLGLAVWGRGGRGEGGWEGVFMGTVWHGKTHHFVGPCIWHCDPESRAGGKTEKTDIKISCDLCLNRHITDGFPSCLSAAQSNLAVRRRNRIQPWVIPSRGHCKQGDWTRWAHQWCLPALQIQWFCEWCSALYGDSEKNAPTARSSPSLISYSLLLTSMREKGNYSQNCQIPHENL